MHDALPSFFARFLDLGLADRPSGRQTLTEGNTADRCFRLTGGARGLLGASARRLVHAPELEASTPGHQEKHGRLDASALLCCTVVGQSCSRLGASR